MRRIQLMIALLLSFVIRVGANTDRPNIIVILVDDMGYSDLGCYGGEVQTPHIDQLASGGIRYKQFYNAARCCPTRASLISGLYPHEAGMGWMAAADLGTPAYQGNLNNESVTIAEVLKAEGYRTYMTGKWHLTNERKIDGMVTDNWPTQRGFDRYFGIIPGGANYFTPQVYSGNQRYPATNDFYLTDAISDTTVRYLAEHFEAHRNEPLFMYVAYTAPHWPLHALQEDIDNYKETYKAGWDKLREQRFETQQQLGLFPEHATMSTRDSAIVAWDRLSPDEQEEMAMRMAIYAAQIDVMDQGVGRIIAELKENDQLDNTLIFFLSDNGACAEYISSGKRKAVDGAADTFESYRINWANLSSTPFKEYKHFTYEGGIATPLIVHWPKGVDEVLRNTLVSEYGHVTDIMATCVDVAGAAYPKMVNGNSIHPMVGKSLVPHFSGDDNNRGKIFWEHEANIAVRDGKWKLVAKTLEGQPFDVGNLQLYDLDRDPIELNDLSANEPERVQRMYTEWQAWGEQIGVFPLDTREYGLRARTYRRNINGSFDDNLGGWNVKVGPNTDASIAIDTTGRLTGKKSVALTMDKPGTKPAEVAMLWPFAGRKGERFTIGINSVAETPTAYHLRLEKIGEDGKKLMDQQIPVGRTAERKSFVSEALPEDGQYRVSLYFGGLSQGDRLWIDDVELTPLSSIAQRQMGIKQPNLPLQRGFTHFYGHYNGTIDYFTLEREQERDWHITGLSMPNEKPLDGVSILPVLVDRAAEINRDFYLGYGTLISENRWKIVSARSGNPRMKLDQDELFDLLADPSEQHDVRAAHPNVYEQLKRKVVQFETITSAEQVAPYGEGRQGFKAPKDWKINK